MHLPAVSDDTELELGYVGSVFESGKNIILISWAILFLFLLNQSWYNYSKAMSISMSWLEACFRFYRLFIYCNLF